MSQETKISQPAFGDIGSLGRSNVLLENETRISITCQKKEA